MRNMQVVHYPPKILLNLLSVKRRFCTNTPHILCLCHLYVVCHSEGGRAGITVVLHKLIENLKRMSLLAVYITLNTSLTSPTLAPLATCYGVRLALLTS